MNSDGRNPLIVPKADHEDVRHECPKCHSKDFGGRRPGGGPVVYTCSSCKNQWQGGISAPPDSRTPTVPKNPLSPHVTVNRDKDSLVVREERRLPSPAPDFRKGAPIPPPGEEDV